MGMNATTERPAPVHTYRLTVDRTWWGGWIAMARGHGPGHYVRVPRRRAWSCERALQRIKAWCDRDAAERAARLAYIEYLPSAT